MSIWERLSSLAQRAFVVDEKPLPPLGECAPDPDDMGFTAAVVGLAAKMARADGVADPAERAAAAAVFRPPPGQERAFARVYDLARQTVHGFESYARQIGKRYRARPCLLEDVLDGLFHIAAADGAVTADEEAYLAAVAAAMGFSTQEFARIRAANLGQAGEAHATLGLAPGASLEEARRAWRRLAAENHPDRVAARGAPAEFVRIAAAKTAAINAAYDEIRAIHHNSAQAY